MYARSVLPTPAAAAAAAAPPPALPTPPVPRWPRGLSLRRSVAFQKFFRAFSVRPGSSLAISLQRLPNLRRAL
jgi:hypothetical protein